MPEMNAKKPTKGDTIYIYEQYNPTFNNSATK